MSAVIEYLKPERGGLFVDCTIGGGGHAEAVLQLGGPGVQLIGLDQDREALEAAGERLKRYSDRVQLVRGNFRDLARHLDRLGIGRVDGVLFDFGVSSHQLDSDDRGFTYRSDAPLDMRMDPDAQLTAAQLVNDLDVQSLARIIQEYGEERWAKPIAVSIVDARRRRPIQTTGQLVDIIKSAIPAAARRRGPHPARRTFQALRIAVNDELGAIREGLTQAVDRLGPGGRLVAISFHSLEDRIVKSLLSRESSDCICPPQLPVCQCQHEARLHVLTRRPIVATKAELEQNPRARSAKLRAAERVLGEKETE